MKPLAGPFPGIDNTAKMNKINRFFTGSYVNATITNEPSILRKGRWLFVRILPKSEMMRNLLSKTAAWLFLFIFFAAPLRPVSGDTFFGNLPTGLLELQNYRYPVYLYVPENYKPDRNYPLLVSVPDEGQAPEEQLQYWANTAKRKSMFVLCATNLWPEDVPYSMDEWLLGIMSDVAQRYRIDKSKTFLVGEKGGAHYAAYLATNHPNEFSSAVLLDGTWSGKFEKLLQLRSRAARQVPFLVVASSQDADRLSQIEKEATEYEKKGYLIALMKVESWDQSKSDLFKRKVLEWLEANSETWQKRIRESQKSWKEKTVLWFENFFHV